MLRFGLVLLGVCLLSGGLMASGNESLEELLKDGSEHLASAQRTKLTCLELSEAERNLGVPIPQDYKDFLLQHGHKVITGVDLAVPHDGKSSSLVAWSTITEGYGLDTETYFPFSKSDGCFYCLHRKNKTVHFWNQFDQEFEDDTWPSFANWLSQRLNG